MSSRYLKFQIIQVSRTHSFRYLGCQVLELSDAHSFRYLGCQVLGLSRTHSFRYSRYLELTVSGTHSVGTRRRNAIKRTLYHTNAVMSSGEFSVTRNFFFDVMKTLSVVIKTLPKEPFCVRFARNVGKKRENLLIYP